MRGRCLFCFYVPTYINSDLDSVALVQGDFDSILYVGSSSWDSEVESRSD